MLGHRELTIDDYLAMLRRRLWVIVLPTLIAPLLAYLVSLKLASQYTSQTLVLVESQKVPESYVQPVITEAFGYRLGTMREQILSRTRLQPIIDRFQLYSTQGTSQNEEKLVKMRKDIMVKPVIANVGGQQSRQTGLPGFSISFTYEDPKIAQQVCGEITSMFIEENLKARQQSARSTTEFLETQLAESKRKLDEQDARLAEFKRKYIGQLPQQEQSNMNLLMGLNTQLEAVTQALSRAQQDKTYTESILGQQVATWQATRQDGTNASPEALQQQLATLQNQLVMLRARYTEDHPDVAKTKNDIAQMKHKLEEAEAASTSKQPESEKKASLMEPPQIQQLRVALRQYEQTIREKTRDEERLQQQIRLYQARVQMTPVVEEQFKDLTRDYQQALNFYNELLAKKSQSAMATDLEMRQQGEQFRVMDPPNLPETPSFPNRLLITLGGLGGGFGVGLVLAFVLESVDKSLRSEEDVTFHLDLPALAVVPVVGEEARGERKNGNRAAFWRRTKRRTAEVRQNAAM